MNLKILDEFNFMKSTTDVSNDYFYDCYNVKYDKQDVLSLDIPNKEQYLLLIFHKYLQNGVRSFLKTCLC